MGRGSDRSLIGKVMTNYMECPMRGEGWSLEIDVPPHAMLIPVWDEWKISLESSRYMPAADQPGLALCRKKQKSQSNAGKKTDFLAWRSLRKKVLWKRFKIVRAPLAACEYIAAVVTVIPFPPKENSRPSPGPLLDWDADAGSSGRSLETPQSPRICLDERSPLIISVFKSPVLWLQYIIKGKL